jgi:hypothetical protein
MQLGLELGTEANEFDKNSVPHQCEECSQNWGFHHFLKHSSVIAWRTDFFLEQSRYAKTFMPPFKRLLAWVLGPIFKLGSRMASQIYSPCGALSSRRRR